MLRYAAPLCLGAFLLFLVQPVIARCILPWFGGTPSVWTTCMLFFQVLLVVGYGYAHLLVTRAEPRRQAVIHGCLLAVSVAALVWMTFAWGAPIVPGAGWKPHDGTFPIPRILAILTVAVGLPYFVLATTSPLLQAWFSRTEPGVSPYRLYSLSNAGSLLGLLIYPFVIEPALAQKQQAFLWAGGYGLFALGCAACAVRAWGLRRPASGPYSIAVDEASDAAPPTASDRALWLILPALASTLLLAVTNHLCQDVAVTPFLWVLPLSLYLLSFIICFDHERWYQRVVFLPALIVAVPLGLLLLLWVSKVGLPGQIAGYGFVVFVCCMVCHGELVALKPAARHLTSFYLAVAVGGALGGALVGLVAPLVFRGYTELPVALVLCFAAGVLVAGRRVQLGVLLQIAGFALIGVMVGLAFLPMLKDRLTLEDPTISLSRNFYGVLRVRESDRGTDHVTHTLLHGRIIHGLQCFSPKMRRAPSSYYGPDSGVGLAIVNHPRRFAADPDGRSLRFGVIGLGTGSLAVYANGGDYLRFYDINPAVVRLSRDSGLFTYLKDCPAQVEIALGDARVSLERELAQGSDQYDFIIMDAFSGDAVPAHLLTREAFQIYLRHLRPPNGTLIVHVSNARLDLRPVVWQAAKRFGLDTCLVDDEEDDDSYLYSNYWMVLTPGPNYLRPLDLKTATWTDKSGRHIREWTDDFYNLFQIVK